MNSKINRRRFLKTLGMGTAALSFPLANTKCQKPKNKPNIIYILADDLGYGELGCYGQTKIKTPNIDKIASEGMIFTQHYSGSPVCAPSRCVLLTGKHTGHSYIRSNDELSHRGDVWHDPELEGQRPLLSGTETIGTIFQKQGYSTGAIGKWGLGGPKSSGHPNKQGFDFFYGYLCQRVAHNYYPTHLWKNGEKELLDGNKYFFPHQILPDTKDENNPESYNIYKGKTYSMDRMAEEALRFIKENKDKPFFLYLPFPVPHVSIQIPEDSLNEYDGSFPETPYKGDKGYTPHISPRAGYAAMITRMDKEIGRILSLLKKLGLDENTLVIFSSDNGPTFNGGTDSSFFNSAGPLRGLKTMLYEGGIRVPMIARWPGKIRPGSTSDHLSAFWDILPTFTDILGLPSPNEIDGISLLPELLGKPEKQKKHDFLYWEYVGKQALRMGDWKAYRSSVEGEIELYNLKKDISESDNIASENPVLVNKIQEIFKSARTESELFPLRRKKRKQD